MDSCKPTPVYIRYHSFLYDLWQLLHIIFRGFPGGSDDRESACQSERPGFPLWVRKIPWRKAWQPTPVFLPGESHGQRGLEDCGPRSHRVGHD